jgi:hypothetical protein
MTLNKMLRILRSSYFNLPPPDLDFFLGIRLWSLFFDEMALAEATVIGQDCIEGFSAAEACPESEKGKNDG